MKPERLEYFRQSVAALKNKTYQDARALPGEFYTDPDWFTLECEHLFARQWVCVGRVEEIPAPGDYFCFDLLNEPLIVIKGEDKVIRVLSNVCRHRGSRLVNGSGSTARFVCPYHGWTYDSLGKLLRAPHLESHQNFNLTECALPEFPCIGWKGFLFTSLDSEIGDFGGGLEALEDLIGNYHIEQQQLSYVTEATWQVNWKNLMENYMEGYHLSPLHRHTLASVNPTRLCRHIAPGENYFAYGVGFAERVAGEGAGHGDLTEDQLNDCIMLALPPSLGIGIGSDYSSFVCLQPVSPGEARVKMGLIFADTNWSTTQVDEAVDLFHRTMAEDKTVLLDVYKGLGSRYYQPGPLAPPAFEGTIWDFYQYIFRKLNTILF